MTARVEALLDELVGTRSIRATLRARLARDPYMPGFGHQPVSYTHLTLPTSDLV